MLQTAPQKVAQITGLILSPVIFSTSTLAQTPDTFPSGDISSPLAPISQIVETIPKNDQVGIQFEHSQMLNQGKLVFLTGTRTETIIETPGRCLGALYIPPTTRTTTTPYTTQAGSRAWFISRTVPAAAGLRVIIQNITPGIDQHLSPYTDREYIQDNRSEIFTVKQDIAHNSRYLAAIPGTNTFTYQIKQGKTIVESGSFTTVVEVETKADKQPEFLESPISVFNNPSNQCEDHQIPDIKVQVPEIEPLNLPEIPSLPPDVQELIDEYTK